MLPVEFVRADNIESHELPDNAGAGGNIGDQTVLRDIGAVLEGVAVQKDVPCDGAPHRFARIRTNPRCGEPSVARCSLRSFDSGPSPDNQCLPH